MPRYKNDHVTKAYERALVADLKREYGAEGYDAIMHERNARAAILASAYQLAQLERRAIRCTGQEGRP